jgi:hypothetical protein
MSEIQSYLATVDKVFLIDMELNPLEKGDNADYIPIYNKNEDFSDKDARLYGAITYIYPDMTTEFYAYPFDKNNFTMPIKGETVLILEIDKSNIFWLPYSVTPYSSYRRDYVTYSDLTPTDGLKPDSAKYWW